VAQATFRMPDPSKFPITAVAWSEDGSQIFSGAIDNDIQCWDVRTGSVAYTLVGHQDTITGA
jgi:Prp8 binding protein